MYKNEMHVNRMHLNRIYGNRMQRKKLLFCLFTALMVQHAVWSQSLQETQAVIPMTSTAYKRTGVSTTAVALLPAAAEFKVQKSIAIAAENRFMVKELSRFHVALALSQKNHATKFGGSFQGSALYAQYHLDAGYALQLNSQLNAGLKLGWNAVRLKGDKPSMQITASVGAVLFIQEKIGWGIHLKTATPVGQLVHAAKGYQEIMTGMGFLLSESIYLSAELAASSTNKLGSNMALRWMLGEQISIQGGISHPMSNLFFNLGWQRKKEVLSVGISSHDKLGLSGLIVLDYALD
jgi:hypothetical protein